MVHVLPPDSLTAPRNRWDLAVECVLGGLLVFMPLAFGAVEAWSELIVIAGATALAAIVTLRTLLDRTFRPRWTAAYAPLILWLALIAAQVAPLPPSVASTISPAAIATRAELLGDASSAERFTTLSMYPLATRHGLRLALVAAAIFFVTASVYQTGPQIKRLLAIVFIAGCLEAALALLQIVTQAQGMYWSIDVGPRRLSSGSFINYSNFSQFMNLSIGAGLALLLVRLQEEHRRGRRRHAASRPFEGLRLQLHAPLLVGLAICIVAVLTSMSRNGAVSMAVAAMAVATALYACGTLGRRGWLLAVLPAGVATVVLLFAFDAVYDRLVTLSDRDQIDSRWELTLDVLRAWQSYPLLGVGLGAHEMAFPMFDRSVTRELAGHADNDYAQLLEETGIVGAILAATFFGLIAAKIVRLARRGRTSISAAAFGLAYGLIAVAVHSVTDFGQRLPAVFGLTAVTCGLVVATSQVEARARAGRTRSRSPSSGVRWSTRRSVAAAGLVAVILAGAWSLRGAYRAFLGDEWWAMAFVIEDQIRSSAGPVDDQEYQDLIAASQQAWNLEPGNAVYGYWLNARRWQALSRDWATTDGETQYPPDAQPLVEKIADELTTVRRACPTFGPPYALEGQLRLFVLGDAAGSQLIQQGVRLASYDPPTCLIAGQVAAREGRDEDAYRLIARAVALDPQFFHEAAGMLLFNLKEPELARQLAGDDYSRLALLTSMCRESAEYARLAVELSSDAEAALRRRAASAEASPAELATLAHLEYDRADYPAAITLYRRALKADYNQAGWRLELARALGETGDYERAAHEARICARLRPSDEARAFAEEMTQRAAASER